MSRNCSTRPSRCHRSSARPSWRPPARETPAFAPRWTSLLACDAAFADGGGDEGVLKSPLVRSPAPPAAESRRLAARKLASRAAGAARPVPDPPPHRRGRHGRRLRGGAGQPAPHRRPQGRSAPAWPRPPSLKRFAHEAQILGRLHHPGIAQVYEAGLADDGQPFFAMEFIRGLPLDEYARRHGLDLAARVGLLARVCDAVQHAHDQGVIHRDLKPANILVEETGQPKVLDFGVARATDADLLTGAGLTRTGQLLGTPNYMSPEQVTADPAAIDHRADVYALGVILFELAGPPPAVSAGEPAPGRGRPADPGARPAAARLARPGAPRRRGDDRGQGAGEGPGAALRVGGGPGGGPAALAGPRADPGAAAVGAVPPAQVRPAAQGPGGRGGRHRGGPGPGARRHDPLRRRRGPAARPGRAERPARRRVPGVPRPRWPPRPRRCQSHDVADAARQLDAAPEDLRGWEWRHLHSRLDDSSAVIPLPAGGVGFLIGRPGPAPGRGLDQRRPAPHGPGGRRAQDTADRPGARAACHRRADPPRTSGRGVGREHGLRPARRGRPGPLSRGHAGGDGVQSRRREPGRHAAGVPLDVTATRSAARGVRRDFRQADGGLRRPPRRHLGFTFSPDGTRLASAGEDRTARLWDAATGALLATCRGHASKVLGVAFSPDGARLVTTSADGTVRQWDAATGREVEPPYDRHSGEVVAAVYSPDGQWVASAGTDRTIRVWRATGRQDVAVLHGHTGGVTEVAFAPDGRRLASLSRQSMARLSRGTTRCGSGTWTRGRPCRCCAATPATSTRWPSARTAAGSPRGAGTARCACGMRRPASRARPCLTPASCGAWPSAPTGRGW